MAGRHCPLLLEGRLTQLVSLNSGYEQSFRRTAGKDQFELLSKNVQQICSVVPR
jgi:hypothetical protein